MENFFQILIISIFQGITEFLPVSSSAHLNLLSIFFNYKENELIINVSAHIGSLLAVVFFFKNEILNFGKNKKLFNRVLIASVPLFLFGYLFVNYNLVNEFRSLKLIGWTTILFGIFLYFSDRFSTNRDIDKNYTLKNAIIIGFLQILALVPGVSRSGIIITGARLLKFNRSDAAKVSFLMSIPALAGTGVFGIYSLINKGDNLLNLNSILTIIFSFFFSYITIKYFLIYLRKFNLNLIVGYRIVFGVMVLLITYL